MNEVMIAGHLGADPEVRFTSSGQKVTTMRVAARARRGSQKEEQTIWWRVTIWGEQFDKMIAFFKKGSAVIVFGELSKPEIFTDRDGHPQVSLNVTAYHLQFSPFGRSASESGASASSSNAPSTAPSSDSFASAGVQQGLGQQESGTGSFSDDEIPF